MPPREKKPRGVKKHSSIPSGRKGKNQKTFLFFVKKGEQ